jgi:hypothetical protein
MTDRAGHPRTVVPGRREDADSSAITRCLVDDGDKRKYNLVVEIPDRDMRERLSAAVVALVQGHDPEVLR